MQRRQKPCVSVDKGGVYLCRGSIEGDAQERAEAQASCHGQCHQQDTRQPDSPLRLGTVPPQHGQTRIGQLGTANKDSIYQPVIKHLPLSFNFPSTQAWTSVAQKLFTKYMCIVHLLLR